ncbi:MAG: phage tail tape measure protein [Candidatus Choladocola sp.]|nr:phage tail tape measure protein [Candidatus Choladocola sp.]
MSEKNDIVAGIRLEGEKEFKDAVTSVNKSLTSMKSELNLVKAEYAGQENTLEALTKKQEVLNRILEEQKKKAAETAKGLNHAKESYANMEKSLNGLYIELEKATDKLGDLEKTYGEGSEEAEEQRKVVAELNEAIERGTVNYKKAGDRVKDWETKLNNAQAQVVKANIEVGKNAAYMKEAEEATDNCATSINAFGKEIQSVNADTNTFADSFLANIAGQVVSKAFDILADGVEKVKDVMYDTSKASAQLAASTGLSESAAKRYQAVMKQIKGDNFGEDYSDVASVMQEVIQIMGELNDAEMKDVTESAIALRDTFNIDVNESIRASDAMMKTMGVDASEAFDLIAKGAQNGLNRSGELTDNITEYAQLWGQAGFSAEEMFSILENGLESGAYNLDKVNDYVKEFGVSMADGRIEKNLSSFSSGTRNLFAEWKNGNASTRDVFYSVINDLEGMENQQKALTIASETWSALGEDNAMQVLTALNDVNDGYKNVKGTMESLKKVKYSDLESAVSGLGAAIEEKFINPIANVALPLATDAINGITSALEPATSTFDQFLGEVETANEQLETSIVNAKSSMENAELEAGTIENLGQRLIKLNNVEDKSLEQRYELRTIVSELGQSIPEIADAYDEEAGKVDLTSKSIRELIQNKHDLLIANAAQAAQQEIVNSLFDAEQQLLKSDETVAHAKEVRDGMQEQYDSVSDMAQQWRDLDEARQNASSPEEGAAYAAQMNEIEKSFDELGITIDGTDEYLANLKDDLNTASTDYDAAKKANDDLNKSVEEGQKQLADLSKVQEDLKDKLNGTKKAEEEVIIPMKKYSGETDEAAKTTELLSGSQKTLFGSTEQLVGAFDSANPKMKSYTEEANNGADALYDEADAIDTAAEAAKAGAEAQKAAAKDIRDTYNGYVEEIKNDLQDKISLFDKFETSDGGEDQTVETMTQNLDSQIAAFENYQENLAAVKDHVGKEIAPEFMQYLESMGMEGSNTLEHILKTFEEGDTGAEKVKEMSDKWVQAMNMSDGIAEAGAANKLAYEESMGDLGSSKADFSELRSSVDSAVASAAEGWGNLPEATKSALMDTIQTAQDCGIKIPDGLAEGIANGEVSPESAMEQLNGSIQGKLEGLADIARQIGVGDDIVNSIVEGIDSGGQDTVNAYNQLIGLLKDASSDAETIGKETAESQSEGFKSGLNEGTGDVSAAGSDMAKAGADAAAKESTGYQKAGTDSVNKYIEALRSAKSRAAQEAGAMASAAKSAAASWQNGFYSVGVNMAAGVASGIRAGQSLAINAAINMAKQALAAAKREADIHSPSEKFRREFGQQIAAGAAFGISDKASLAGKEAAKMSLKVYTKATSWLAKYKKSQAVSLEDEKYYWEKVLKHVKSGTSAYNKAVGKLASVSLTSSGLSASETSKATKQISSNFSVSKKDSKGKTKDAATYYSEIYSAAEKYLKNRQTLNDWSLEQELAYWQSVQKQLKSGTQAWYDAQGQIKNLKADIEQAQADAAKQRIQTTASNQTSILDKYKTYYKMSAKAEMEYWNIARQQFKTGTDERIEADQKYLEAMQDYYDQRKELDEDYAENSREINEKLADDIKDLQDAYHDAVQSRKEDILSSMDLFESWDASGYDADTLIYNLKTQVAGLTLWEQQLEELGKKNISAGLLEELKEMGPDAAANIYSLNQMTAEQLDEYNKLWEQKNALAMSQAVKDNESLRLETNQEITKLRTDAMAELTALNTDYRAAIAELETGISSDLKNIVSKAGTIGEDAVSGLIAGIGKAANSVDTYKSTTKVVTQLSSQLSSLQQEGTIIGKNTLDGLLEGLTDAQKINMASKEVIQSIKRAMEEEAEIHSPARLFRRETGPQIPAGVALGMEDGTKQAVKSAHEMMRETLAAAQEEMNRQQAALQAEASMLDFSGINRINRLMETPVSQNTKVNVDNGSVISAIGQIAEKLPGMLTQAIMNLQMVTDTGVLAGVMQPLIDKANGEAMIIRNRGR